MKFVRSSEMRELDRRTIEEFHVPGTLLMERAGLGVANGVDRLSKLAGYLNPLVRLFAGHGNNGGDAFVAARHLKRRGLDVELWLATTADQVTGDAAHHLTKLSEAGITPVEMPDLQHWERAANESTAADILVDGLLGTGIEGPPREPEAAAIRFINAGSVEALVVAIDVPSGLDADTGETPGDTVMADLTLTMGLPKTGLGEFKALDYVGNLDVVDIGIPAQLLDQVDTQKELITPADLMGLFARRPRAAHKGTYGRILLIGGSLKYPGAIAMAAKAAVRSGAGLVTAIVPQSLATVIPCTAPEAIVQGVPETPEGTISSNILPTWRRLLADYDAVLIGPGMTSHDETRKIVMQTLRECSVPLVLDADAINVLVGRPGRIHHATCPVIITPHPGEMARLMGVEISTIQADRMFTALKVAATTDATIVLKGAGTVVAAPGHPPGINLTGNPGMATGGMGDALAGLLAGLLGQGLDPFDAARAAVYLHGRAGDLARWRTSQAGLIATDVIEELPYAFRDITLR